MAYTLPPTKAKKYHLCKNSIINQYNNTIYRYYFATQSLSKVSYQITFSYSPTLLLAIFHLKSLQGNKNMSTIEYILIPYYYYLLPPITSLLSDLLITPPLSLPWLGSEL